MKKQLNIFFTALMFYTRIPSPYKVAHHPSNINKATRYFPLIGWIVGLISFGVFYISSSLFNPAIAVALSLIAGVVTTGAFHEDGLADVFDGFGGGWTKEKILEIMKDSRVGAYGAISLIFLFLLKFLALLTLVEGIGTENLGVIAAQFIAYHSLARLTAINIVFFSQYSREDASSKVKPIAKAHGKIEMIGAYLFGLLPLLLMSLDHISFLFVIFPLFILFYWSKKFFEKWIDGYTGDCLGAVEQIAECVTILSFISIWKFM